MMKSIIIIAAVVLIAGCGWTSGPAGLTQHEHKVVELDKADLTHVNVTMGAGQLEMTGGATTLLQADFTYNVVAWKPTVTHTSSGSEGEVEIAQSSQSTVSGRTENHWQLALNDGVPLDVVAHVGAGEAHLALGDLNLRSLDVRMGAGELDLDLDGKPAKSYRVAIHGGVGKATVHLPSSVAISATASGALGDINVSGLEKRNGRWINPRVESGPVTIELDVQGAVGEIAIVAD
jgi:N-terminal domain of toast_rack, DUF2154